MAVKTIIGAENKHEASEIFAFVQSLDSEKREAFASFVDGARFMLGLMADTQPPAERPSA